jgi:hypothetical protein
MKEITYLARGISVFNFYLLLGPKSGFVGFPKIPLTKRDGS